MLLLTLPPALQSLKYLNSIVDSSSKMILLFNYSKDDPATQYIPKYYFATQKNNNMTQLDTPELKVRSLLRLEARL